MHVPNLNLNPNPSPIPPYPGQGPAFLIISDTMFTGNQALFGGAMMLSNTGGKPQAQPSVLVRCSFTANHAMDTSNLDGMPGAGGAILVASQNIEVAQRSRQSAMPHMANGLIPYAHV